MTTKTDSFSVGTTVIYGTLGKCKVSSIETRTINGEEIPFYRLEPVRSTFSRSSRQDPSIWLPIASANKRGLRTPINAETAAALFELFSNREYFFSIHDEPSRVLPELEQAILTEGAIGLAKAYSFFYVIKRRQIVLPNEYAKLEESVQKLLMRELSEATDQPSRVVEEQITKLLRKKIQPDH